MKLALICYCAFSYGVEFTNALNLLLDDEVYKDYNYPYLIPVIILVVFVFAPIMMPLNWLVNTIRFIREK